MNATSRLLIDCLHEDASRLDAARLAQVGDGDWDDLLTLARRQRLRPQVQRRLAQPDVRDRVPAHVTETLRAACTAVARRNLELHAELLRLLERFDAAGLPIAPLKGMHLATAAYGDVARREIWDLDLLVPREHLARAVALAAAAGYAPRHPIDVETDAAVHHHVGGLVNQAQVYVELHWTIARPVLRRIDPAVLWADAEPIEVFGRRTLALSPGHLLLHVCLHLVLEDQCESGLRGLCDLSALIRARSNALDWARVRRQAEEWDAVPGVALALRMARDVIGVAIPDDASAAFELDRLPAEVVDAALAVALAAHDRTAMPSRTIGALRGDTDTARRGYLKTLFGTPVEELRRMYPRFPRSRWIWWTVYVLRARDLVRRHGRTLARLFVTRDATLRSTMESQRRLTEFLANGR